MAGCGCRYLTQQVLPAFEKVVALHAGKHSEGMLYGGNCFSKLHKIRHNRVLSWKDPKIQHNVYVYGIIHNTLSKRLCLVDVMEGINDSISKIIALSQVQPS
jgi:hypothetical protein